VFRVFFWSQGHRDTNRQTGSETQTEHLIHQSLFCDDRDIRELAM